MPGLFYDSGNESSHRCTLPLSPFEETVLQIRSALLAAALLVALPQIAVSQSDNSSLSGAVTDTSGALLPNAKVTVRNTATGAESVSTTNSSGNFILPNVEPGKYTVRIESPGFTGASDQGCTSCRYRSAVQPVAHLLASALRRSNLSFRDCAGRSGRRWPEWHRPAH